MNWPWQKSSKKKGAPAAEAPEADGQTVAEQQSAEPGADSAPVATAQEPPEEPPAAVEPQIEEPEQEPQEEERFPPEVQNKAISWFRHAKQVADTRNYDYALELYCGGLKLWPEAVEEGIKPMYELGIHRLASGGKKAGMRDRAKHSATAKDPKEATANALFLLAKNPEGINEMEAVLKAAARGPFKPVMQWIGPMLFRKAGQEKPEKVSRYRTMWQIMEKHEFLEMAFRAIERAVQMKPGNMELKTQMKNIAALRSAQDYEHAEDFRDSLKDAEEAKALAQEERLVQTEDAKDRKVNEARAEYESEPTQVSKLMKLVNALVERKRGDDEREAIDLLEAHYQRTKNYRLKIGADDIRIRQLRRRCRLGAQAVEKAPPGRKQELQERLDRATEELHSFALKSMQERCQRYPTDRPMRFEYGEVLLEAGKYDEAIPQYQIARDDPRRTVQAMLRIGECFFQLKYYKEAADNFEGAIARHEIEADDLAKELRYWLGLTYEEMGETDKAAEAYSQLAQWQFDYRDVRARLDRLRKR